jgi:hypothetical protein
MLLWLSVVLLPLIGGGVVGPVLQQYRPHETRHGPPGCDRVLTLERTHHLLHDAEVAGTARLLARSDPDMAFRLRTADADAVRSLRRLETVVAPSERPYVQRARMLWHRAERFASVPRRRPADEDDVRALPSTSSRPGTRSTP